MLNSGEKAICADRSCQIDYDHIEQLHFIGIYERQLPVSMARMIENAYDWEHLPFVHASSFSTIELFDNGTWGWRARAGLPAESGGGFQIIELLVDRPKNYWATSIVDGTGTGIQIHTQANALDDREIEIQVRFYSDVKVDEVTAATLLEYLRHQYQTLYDEDAGLMSGRQSALDARVDPKANEAIGDRICVGNSESLSPDAMHVAETPAGRFCIRYWQDRWIVHSAVCTHLLGPLDESKVDEHGRITCPWHGYRFDAASGQNLDGKCKALDAAPRLTIDDGVADPTLES